MRCEVLSGRSTASAHRKLHAVPRAGTIARRTLGLVAGVMLLVPVASAQAWHFDPPRPPVLQSAPGTVQPALASPSSQPSSATNPPLAPSGLPLKWCGVPQPAGRLSARATPAFQLVYAHPADQPDHFWRFANLLQGDVSYIDRFIAAESARTKQLRFVMHTSCGPQFVSLIDWQMPRPRLGYIDTASGGFPKYVQFDQDAVDTFGRAAGVDTLIYIDGLVSNPAGTIDTYGGIAEGLDIGDTSHGAQNSNNQGGQFAYEFGVVGGTPPPGGQAFDPAGFLHEASHAIGAVSLDAPNSTGADHCNVTQDVMCYADGGPMGQAGDLRAGCAPRDDVMAQPYDCTGQTYFNPKPAPGSYLATHWNLYDSAFMAPCGENEIGCGTAQTPIRVSARTRAGTLTLSAVTLSNRTVRIATRLSGRLTGARATICLSSDALVVHRSVCGRRASRRRSGPSARIAPANGEGWRTVKATARITQHGRAHTIHVTVRLP